MSRTILVTGAGGYIGSVATYMLLQAGHTVIAIDNLNTGFKQPLEFFQNKYPDTFRFYEANLGSDLSSILDKEKKIEAVLHYAAHCSVNESMEQPDKYFDNNVASTHTFIKQLIAHDIKTIVFSSTCAVYGEAEYVPIDEKHPTNPANPYGESKLMAETIIKWYGELKGLNYAILRYFNVCGASDDSEIGDAKKPSPHLMQNAVRGALGIEPFALTCGTFDTPDGTPIRDYVNVVDLNTAHILALEYLLGGGKSEIINLGTGTGNSVMEIVDQVQDLTGHKFNVDRGPARAGEYPKMIADTTKAEKVLGWKPAHTLEQSVQSLVNWYKAHPKGWEY
ncbi:MAG: UDP-glucose 4-epimerase GalE [Weeksellaceae bacterium]